MRRQTSDLVVKRRASAWVRYGLPVVAVVLLLAAGMGLYTYGEGMAGFNAHAASQTTDQLRQKIANLEQRNSTLNAHLVAARDAIEADAAAYAKLTTALKQSDGKVDALMKKVGFYHDILNTAPKHGVKIEHFSVRHGAKGYHYHLVLIQSFAFRRWIYATVRLRFKRSQSGQATGQSAPAFVDRSVNLHFKYFSDTRGRFALPVGFVPSAVTVQVNYAGRVQKHTYVWSAVNTAP